MRFLLLLPFLLSACAPSPNNDATMDDGDTRGDTMDAAEARVVMRDEPFSLQRGEIAQFGDEDDTLIRFDRIGEDSRCPADVDCVRAGEAVAHFTLMDDEESTTFTLEIPGMVMEMRSMDDVQLEKVGDRFVGALLMLQPYPGTDEADDTPVTATIELRRLTR